MSRRPGGAQGRPSAPGQGSLTRAGQWHVEQLTGLLRNDFVAYLSFLELNPILLSEVALHLAGSLPARQLVWLYEYFGLDDEPDPVDDVS